MRGCSKTEDRRCSLSGAKPGVKSVAAVASDRWSMVSDQRPVDDDGNEDAAPCRTHARFAGFSSAG